MTTKVLESLRAELPPILFRSHPNFRALTGLHPRTLANLDSLGRGPAGKVVMGRRVGYERDALLEWLAARLRVEHRQCGAAA